MKISSAPKNTPSTSNISINQNTNAIKKHKVPPITIDNLLNIALLLNELSKLLGIKQTAKLLDNSLKIVPTRPVSYHETRRFNERNQVQGYTYQNI
ncbi:hypothetical protein NPIL_553571 [Nephila pilipes]|uniref:Uncharacterized protein n=1 Tax=Nephila pilipes TaxID=299642 RepID=A0A8X6ULB3_NEPPI|nr:hypothetical protein NPIL_553571 [Nephila pilipes]